LAPIIFQQIQLFVCAVIVSRMSQRVPASELRLMLVGSLVHVRPRKWCTCNDAHMTAILSRCTNEPAGR